jgi:hypothetical protein
MNQDVDMEFLLFLKLKNQTIENTSDAKKYSMIKEIELQDGDNLIGSDICKCNIYLPFEELPGVMGNIQVKNEDSVKKFFLIDYGKSTSFYVSKSRSKQMPVNKPIPFKPSQKLFISNLVEMHVQMILNGDSNSMCFEEENTEEQKEGWDLEEQKSEDEAKEEDEEDDNKENETTLGKRNGDHLEEPKEPEVTLKDMAEDQDILSKVKNPFSKQEKEQKITTPKKKGRKKKKQVSEQKTSLKIINYFKIIEKKNTDVENTVSKQESEPIVQETPTEVPSKKLFTKKQENKNNKDKVPDPTKFKKGGNFLNLLAGGNDLEDNLNVIRDSLKKTKGKQSTELNEKKLQNQVLKVLLKKADVIQHNPTHTSEELVENLKKLSSLKWWICFSNISYSKKHDDLVNALRKISNISIFEDFEKFVNTGNEDSQVQKVLIMGKYKRTYKLIVAMNKNILPLSYGWAEDVAKNKNIFSNPCNFFIEYPQDQKILPGYNKSNVVGWFKHHSHKFKINLQSSYLTRKQSIYGFLENHNVIIFDKCFRGIRLENLNINRNASNVPRKSKVRGIRSSNKENDNSYIMRRIVETADGNVRIINNLNELKENVDSSMVNVLVVNHFDHPELSGISKEDKIKVFSKESFLNSFLKQYLHSNEQLRCSNANQVKA